MGIVATMVTVSKVAKTLPSLAELRIITVRHSHDRAKLPLGISLIGTCFIGKTKNEVFLTDVRIKRASFIENIHAFRRDNRNRLL